MAFQWIKLGGEFGIYDNTVMADLQQKRDAFLSPRLKIFELKDLLIRQRDGDNSTVAHYAEIATRHATQGVDATAKNTQAKAFMDEVEACCGILSNTSSTIAQVNAAVDQILSILRNAPGS